VTLERFCMFETAPRASFVLSGFHTVRNIAVRFEKVFTVRNRVPPRRFKKTEKNRRASYFIFINQAFTRRQPQVPGAVGDPGLS